MKKKCLMKFKFNICQVPKCACEMYMQNIYRCFPQKSTFKVQYLHIATKSYMIMFGKDLRPGYMGTFKIDWIVLLNDKQLKP